MITLTPQTLEAFKADVLKSYPNEACGLVIGDNYYECTNAHPEPTKYFRITAEERVSLSVKHGAIEAVLHSHPYDLKGSVRFVHTKEKPEWPSVVDQAAFIADNVPWGIVSTDGKGTSNLLWLTDEPEPALTQRHFDWFVADCYTCIRDWHKLNTKIILPNFTRKWAFWKEGKNTIEEGIARIPFAKKYPADKAIIGDIAVFCLGGHGVVNHLGVITATNDLLHQFCTAGEGPGMYAHTTRWDMWKKKAKYVVRLEVPKNAS